MKPLLAIALSFLLLGWFIFALKPGDPYRHSGKVLLPNPELTPGDWEDVPLDELCVKGYAGKRRAKQYGAVSWYAVRKEAFRQYGVLDDHGGVCVGDTRGCEGDHLLPELLGGKTSVLNVWPEPYGQHPGASEKDALENKLRHLVCVERTLTLRDARGCIISDWWSCYLKYVK